MQLERFSIFGTIVASIIIITDAVFTKHLYFQRTLHTLWRQKSTATALSVLRIRKLTFRIGPHYKSGGAAVDLKLVFHFGWPIRSHLSVLVGSDQHVSKYGSKEDSTIIYHTSGYSRVNSRQVFIRYLRWLQFW